MRDLELGLLARALRRRRGWRQEDCARRARIHRSTWSNLERGRLGRMSVDVVRRCLAVVEVRLDLVPHWRGSQLDRLLDERHAALQAAWKARLERWGWLVLAEASYSRYGERGRIDLLAWYAPRRILLVVEVKTEIADVQELLGSLDVKRRLAPHVASELGWPRPLALVPALIVAEDSTNRRRIASLSTLFAHLGTRGRPAISWLRRPGEPPGGLLILSLLSPANGSRGNRVGASRERVRRPIASVGQPPASVFSRPDPG